MPASRLQLADFLRKLDSEKAKHVIALTVFSAINSIKSNRARVSLWEQVIFNLDVLLFCKEELRDKNFESLIAYGMELSDIDNLVHDRTALDRACDEINKILDRQKMLPVDGDL